jgi:hypothetical protein
MANSCGIISGVTDSEGIKKLRQLAAKRKKTIAALDAEIDELTEQLLRDGEYVESIAAARDVSRETIRRFRKEREIPDARATRSAKGEPRRRPRG